MQDATCTHKIPPESMLKLVSILGIAYAGNLMLMGTN